MKHKLVAAGLALALGAGFALNAYSQAKPDVLVKQRQAAMTLQGKYFGPMAGMAGGRVPYDAAVITRNAGYLEALSRMPWDGFQPATADIKSATLPEAYKDAAKFKDAADRFQSDVGKLVVAARSGNEGSVKAAIGDVGKACGACHESFRQKQ
ncbi:MAG: cytochrome c [Betaproteobacteria bacterium]|nr:cytochrome c [Betaproteobacteria bacterium]